MFNVVENELIINKLKKKFYNKLEDNLFKKEKKNSINKLK